MMNGIVIRYVCLLILSLLLQTWNYLIRLSQELQLVSVLPRRFTDVGELIGIATSQKNGLQKYNLIPNFSNSGGIWCIGTLPNNNFLCTFLISVNHTSFKQSGVSLLQIIGTGDENFKANYKSLIKGTQEAKFYAKYNEKGINVYVDAPANITVSILSYSHMAKDFYFNLQKQESLPEGCTQAVDVDTL